MTIPSIYEVFLHFRYIDDSIPGQFFKLCIVNVCPVKSKDVSSCVIGWFEHEAVIGRRRCELDVRRYALIGVNIGMYFYPAFLFS